MSSDAPALTIRTAGGYAEVDESAWDRCAGSDNPFVSYRFLRALEDSGSTTDETGWAPRPLLLEAPTGELIAAAPAYMKTHSFGEYVFDHCWADAFEQAGGRYYPKLQVASPFTPVPGPRLLAAPGHRQEARLSALVRGMTDVACRLGVSSLHVTFCSEKEWSLLGAAAFILRTGEQFHWSNAGYDTFEHFLAELSSRKRKAVRRERREVASEGSTTIRTLEGAEVRADHWDTFFDFYTDTGQRKWGRPYLTRKFFQLVGERMSSDVVLMLAYRGGSAIAGALHFKGRDALFGRYWGAADYYPSLHFELCYYRAIEYAIRHRLARVEAGAQGPHKLARGYLPVRTYSAHWIAHPGLRAAVAEYAAQERQHVDTEISQMAEFSPFRQGRDSAV